MDRQSGQRERKTLAAAAMASLKGGALVFAASVVVAVVMVSHAVHYTGESGLPPLQYGFLLLAPLLHACFL